MSPVARRASLASLALHLLATAALVIAARRATGGAASYPLDDAFIHLALAKNLAHHGVFGVTRFAFTSTSSSVLWPFLLAPLEGPLGDAAPLALATLTTAPLGPLAAALAERRGLSTGWVYGAAIGAVLLAPGPGLACLGMEHGLHAVASLALLALAGGLAAPTERPFDDRLLPLAAFVAAGARYEGALLVGAVALARLAHPGNSPLLRLRAAAAIATAGALPIVAFGVWALRHGAPFLPYSVLMKGARPEGPPLVAAAALAGDALGKLARTPSLILALLAVPPALGRRGPEAALVARVALLVTALHVLVAAVGWFFRYEAYLVLLLAYAALPTVTAPRPARRAATAAVALALVAPALARSAHMIAQTPRACRNIFEQQVQVARFLAREFPAETVAVNDIGAVAYYREGPLVDLMGLASGSVARARGYRLASALPPAVVAREVGRAPVAVLYPRWFDGQLPEGFSPRRRWTIRGPITPAFPDVVIYATDPAAVPIVDGAILRYERELPDSVSRSDP